MRTRTAELTHEGGMRFAAQVGSGHVLVFDDREDVPEPGPMDTVLAALAGCTAMDVVSIALKKRQGIDSYRVHASAEQRDEYPQVYTRIDPWSVVRSPARWSLAGDPTDGPSAVRDRGVVGMTIRRRG